MMLDEDDDGLGDQDDGGDGCEDDDEDAEMMM